jgi:hypothetical protein
MSFRRIHTARDAWLWALLLPLALGACGAEAAVPPFVAYDSAGIHVAESRAPAWGERALIRVAEQPSVVIGAAEGGREYLFSRIVRVERLSSGVIVVADRTNLLRFYDEQGRHLRSVGGMGRGPGEFEEVEGLSVVGDTIVVFDGMLRRITAFDGEGTLLRTTQLRGLLNTVRFYELLDVSTVDGSLVFFHYGSGRVTRHRQIRWLSSAMLRYHADGSFADTVGEPLGHDQFASRRGTIGAWFGRRSSAVMHGAELYIADGGEYEVRVYELGGPLRRIPRIPLERRPVTPEHIEMARRDYVDDAPAHLHALRAQVFAQRLFPEQLPWTRGLAVDPEGLLWVGEYEVLQEPRRWSVFDPEGRWLGRVELPEGVRVHRVGRDHLIGVHRDEMEIERVVVYPLIRDASE